MPRKTDTIPINNELLDRRVKLTQDDKKLIVWLREEEQISYQTLANRFGVSRRSIIFICRPELKVKDLENRKKRGGSKLYYNKDDIQHISSILCGYFCIGFLHYAQYNKAKIDIIDKMNNYVELFNKNTKTNDKKIKDYINHYYT
jgi:hypothetical protein